MQIITYVKENVDSNPNVSQIATDIFDYANKCMSKFGKKSNKFKNKNPEYLSKCIVLERYIGEIINSGEDTLYYDRLSSIKEEFEGIKLNLIDNPNGINNRDELISRIDTDIQVVDTYKEFIDYSVKISKI